MKTELSPMESNVLGLMSSGYSNKEMCQRLDLSVKTVEKHRQNIYRKFWVCTTIAAIRVGIRKNYVTYEHFMRSSVGETQQ